jgi:hypothetical protein
MQRKRWSDLDPQQRVMIMIGGVIQLALLGATLFDLRRRPAEQIRGPKKLWFGLAFVNYVGPIAYFLFGRKRGMAAAVPTAVSE